MGGEANLELAPRRFLDVLEAHAQDVRAHLDRPVQTNEVARCAGLIGGFLLVAGETRLPLVVYEVGASSGLNLRFDHYRYSSGSAGWGDPASPVRFEDVFDGAAPPLDAPLSVAERRGCDACPLDPRSDEDRLTLMSYVWPDQTERFGRLRAALEVAARDQVAVERAGAAEWAARMLAERRPGFATVLFHSVVVQYLTAEEGAALHGAIIGGGWPRHQRRAVRMAVPGTGRGGGRRAPDHVAGGAGAPAGPGGLPLDARALDRLAEWLPHSLAPGLRASTYRL